MNNVCSNRIYTKPVSVTQALIKPQAITVTRKSERILFCLLFGCAYRVYRVEGEQMQDDCHKAAASKMHCNVSKRADYSSMVANLVDLDPGDPIHVSMSLPMLILWETAPVAW